MKSLLKAIQTQLKTSIGYVRNGDIYVTEDIRLVRDSGGYPAIGLKDNGTGFGFLSGDDQEDSLGVVIAVYVKLLKQSAGIMGDASSSNKGLLEIAADVVADLKDNKLGNIVDMALPKNIGASELLVTENLWVQMIPIQIQYTRY